MLRYRSLRTDSRGKNGRQTSPRDLREAVFRGFVSAYPHVGAGKPARILDTRNKCRVVATRMMSRLTALVLDTRNKCRVVATVEEVSSCLPVLDARNKCRVIATRAHAGQSSVFFDDRNKCRVFATDQEEYERVRKP